ncbi:FAD-binding oxidoreductase [Ectobacillus sp. JY-23]|uniref:FAD-binding oxidoreductase n=1 Tax=Ectobacillus sp. JY-23 TaxID=2933872 RepID=UPI001FF492DB|nr:FAD-binding oxidoreductase [Ectobacillus sp. JY-23]UOY94426.1 FAD-binding oxidoreductase [Ectobacillus sp. JY-23]
MYSACFVLSVSIYLDHIKNPTISDRGRLLPTKVKVIHNTSREENLQKWLRETDKTSKISIAGMQHSQGGHTYYPGGTVLDMKGYNKIIAFNPEEKWIRVQSGATWHDIQRVINSHGLALQVTQSQNIFTVGGSLSVNVHGRDIRHGSFIETVQSFRLLTADGTIRNVSRTENPELFSLVIGGYGLFGIVLDITLSLTNNELYQKRTHVMTYKEYTSYFRRQVEADEKVRMHMARISIEPNSFLQEMYATDYVKVDNLDHMKEYEKLKEDSNILLPKFFLGLSRYSEWGKTLFWNLQKNYFTRSQEYETRNNAMRSETAFMEYESASHTEILQEYFVPVDSFTAYIDELRAVLKQEELNVLNITIRYVKQNEEAVLSYAKEDMFAFVFLIRQGRSSKDITHTQQVIRKMINVTLSHGGSYYLPYYSYPSQAQLRAAYPRSDEFFRKKKEYDPNERFVNLFYKEYGL